ncbi:MAG: choice-of-anchor tandem repeat GloVer-containing protein [Acidithiobacillus ferrivorans]
MRSLPTRYQICIREHFRIVQPQVTIHRRATFLILRRSAAALGRLAAVAALTVALAGCERTSVLHSFGTKNIHGGKRPSGGLVMDAHGDLYGTTQSGGADHCGTVFKITPSGVESVVYSFGSGNAHDGKSPNGGLVIDARGNLYGTTALGGTDNGGTVFRITPSGVESVLHSFGTGNVHDGKYPNGGLVMDNRGNLYGTTVFGGTANKGTVFKITPSGVESVLYSFSGGGRWVDPHGGLVMDNRGNLYGTTVFGGADHLGSVFKITRSGAESTFYSFGGGLHGDQPNGYLLMGKHGSIYGTASGGTNSAGIVFKITRSGAGSVLHAFRGGYDGSSDPCGGLVMDPRGNLYGTAEGGGKLGIVGYLTIYLSRKLGIPSDLSGGLGTVFMITPSGVGSVLHSFGTGDIDQEPLGGLVIDARGDDIYGTTSRGGTANEGTVFKVTPSTDLGW